MLLFAKLYLINRAVSIINPKNINVKILTKIVQVHNFCKITFEYLFFISKCKQVILQKYLYCKQKYKNNTYIEKLIK